MRTNVIRKIGLSLLIGTFAFGMTLHAEPVEETYAKVKTEGAVLIDTPNSESVTVKDLIEDEIAYIEAELIQDIAEPEEVKVDQGQEVVNFALKYVGGPYKYGGNSLTNGVDCSGFTSQVYKNFGKNIQRTSGGQYSSSGTRVNKSDLKPGDLVFYGYNGRVNHVAIYMGDNKIVHAGTAKTGIHVSPLQQRGMAPYIGAKRMV